MSEDKELSIVRELIEATKQDRLHWERLVDPICFKFLSSVPTGRAFVLTAPHPKASPTSTGEFMRLEEGVRLQIRDRQDRLLAEIGGTGPADTGSPQDPRVAAVRELFALVRGKDEEEIGQVLGELRDLKTS